MSTPSEHSPEGRTALTALRIVGWIVALLASFGLIAFAFGYFDASLAEDRRWFGSALIVAGMITILPAAVRLAEDWRRLRPEHSVDAAFLQIGLGVIVLAIAGVLGGRFATFVKPLVDREPRLANPAAQAEAANRASTPDATSRTQTVPGRPSTQPQR